MAWYLSTETTLIYGMNFVGKKHSHMQPVRRGTGEDRYMAMKLHCDCTATEARRQDFRTWATRLPEHLKHFPLYRQADIYKTERTIFSSFSTGWTIGVLGFDSRRGLGIFLLTTASRTALGPTQPPIQWIPGALSLEIKRPGREADHSPPSNAKVKEWVKLYFQSPNTPSWRSA
jgi:hypothetical protein